MIYSGSGSSTDFLRVLDSGYQCTTGTCTQCSAICVFWEGEWRTVHGVSYIFFLINVGSLGINPNVWKKSNKIVPYRISKKEFSRPAILLCEQFKKIQLTRGTLHNWADDAELLLNPVIVSRNEKERVLIEPSINSVCLLYSSSIPPPPTPGTLTLLWLIILFAQEKLFPVLRIPPDLKYALIEILLGLKNFLTKSDIFLLNNFQNLKLSLSKTDSRINSNKNKHQYLWILVLLMTPRSKEFEFSKRIGTGISAKFMSCSKMN